MNIFHRTMIATLAICASLPAAAQSAYPGQHGESITQPVKIALKAKCFDLQDVHLLPGRFKENMKRDSAWMVSIPVPRLLHSFRTNAGVYSENEGGYFKIKKLGGWEQLDCDLRGHTTGHLLSAYALMYANTGSEIFKLKGDSIITGLAEVQDALHGGYLSAFPENLIDRSIAGKSVWAPWYTLHKLLSGLIDQYLHTGNTQALEIARKFSGWAFNKVSPLTPGQRTLMLKNEFGGISEAFYNLYAITGDERDLKLAGFFYHDEVLTPLEHPNPDLGTRHANTFIPKVIGEARNYELTGKTDARDIALNFWNEMVGRHTLAPGCVSDRERLFKPEEMSHHISGYTGETCCTYNLLKLSRHIFCWNASPVVADYYERALFNHILGQQDPESGMLAYFLPLKSGSHKVYSTPENSFWCCVGSGFESHAKYAESIYFKGDNNLYINLFIPSIVEWKEKGLTIVQNTSFPENDVISLEVKTTSPVKTALSIRYPSWSRNAVVTINGKKVKTNARPGEYIVLERNWKNGDTVSVRFPMYLTFEPTNDDPDRGALLYGPIVLAGERGTEGMQSPAPFSNPALHNDYYTYDFHIPASLSDTLEVDRHHPGATIKKDPDALVFRTSSGEIIRPLYDMHHRRYVVYWHLKSLSKTSEQ